MDFKYYGILIVDVLWLKIIISFCQCNVLNEKLESLLVTLNDEAEASTPSQVSTGVQ